MRVAEYADIGQYLLDVRESRHITLEQAEAELHIRAKYLKSIETGNLSELPGSAYTRGYIRRYSEYLQVNSDEVIEAFDKLSAGNDNKYFVPENLLKKNIPSRKILWVSIIGVIILYGYWYFAVYDREPVPENGIESPDVLNRSPMDKEWASCLNNGNVKCFVELEQNKKLYSDTTYFAAQLKLNQPK